MLPIPRKYISAKLLFIVYLCFIQIPLYSNPKSLEAVKKVEKILKSDEYSELFIIDDFEGTTLWKIHRATNFLNRTEFIAKTPSSDTFQYETKVYQTIYPITTMKSLMLHSYFEIPKLEKVFIKPTNPISFPRGIPIRIFLWVYSNNYNMDLYLTITQNLKEIPIELGNLKFQGWKRIEAQIPLSKNNRILHDRKNIPFIVKGFTIKGGSFQKKGSFFIYLDQMAVLLDKSTSIYPGSEILDDWDIR